MGRPRKYSRAAVVETAMGMFWRDGYKATSVGDIVRETGLNTASMYKEFVDKDGLFLETLKHYRGHVIKPRYEMLRDNPNIAGVEAFIGSVMTGAARSEYKGCLMMNHLSQKHVIGPDAVQEIGAFCSELESLIETALINAQRDGDIGPDKDPAVLASFVVFCVHGAVLYGRHYEKKRMIPNLYDVVMGALRG
ncbi:TetR/AcrR family transcriptional regulator [Defluviimonas salinarum]|uniref:TetR/AcrR family transcriptional regulator n=1 Tax=Defluviimonas salinarum TaxID=2992147 RepID=A0ABT3J3J3_9RHOB|nr:TetR/AcrR family transcriptional regulator [Defluviimonas salinarum]MCW3781959.1 TetR/AcrR family transcriptional regulator [Defluviimonas salinarum]